VAILFIFPAIVRRGNLTISVATNGISPSLSKRIKKDLSVKYDKAYAEFLEILSEYRVSINVEGYMPVLFDFDVQDDQTFGFHMQERITDRNTMPLLFRLLLNIFQR